MVVVIYCRVFEQKQTKSTLLWWLVYVAGFLNKNRQKGHPYWADKCCRVFEQNRQKVHLYGGCYKLQGF